MNDVVFNELSAVDKRDALRIAASRSGRRAHLLEKDIWVVWTLSALFEGPFGESLTFKGGTSLSKAYRAIRRFSEDLDITYDIRRMAPDLVAGSDDEVIPGNRSQENSWTREIRKRLPLWVTDHAMPVLESNLDETGVSAHIRVEGESVYVSYDPLFDEYGFVKPEVMVEFGARSTGEPREEHFIECYAAGYLTEVTFPSCHTFVMLAERTFWEKATAVHVFCRSQRSRGERLSRHWYDLVRLDDAGFAEKAFADRDLALMVARHKSLFFREKDITGNWIDYHQAVSGQLQLTPQGEMYQVIADDYASMADDGMIPDGEEGFDQLMERCADIANRANKTEC